MSASTQVTQFLDSLQPFMQQIADAQANIAADIEDLITNGAGGAGDLDPAVAGRLSSLSSGIQNIAQTLAALAARHDSTGSGLVVVMAQPNSGSVSGTIRFSATASSVGSTIAGVQFKVDGVNVGAEVATLPYEFSWDSTTVPNGGHSLTAIARDTAGKTLSSVVVGITVQN